MAADTAGCPLVGQRWRNIRHPNQRCDLGLPGRPSIIRAEGQEPVSQFDRFLRVEIYANRCPDRRPVRTPVASFAIIMAFLACQVQSLRIGNLPPEQAK